MQAAILQNPGVLSLNFHTDSGHGWLEVPHSLIYELGIQEEISSSSYMDEVYAYLEEDGDFSVFMRAFEKTLGQKLVVNERSTDGESSIRHKQFFDPAKLATPTGLLDLTVSAMFVVKEKSGKRVGVHDSFNWQVSPTNARSELMQRLREEAERQSKFGWLAGKELEDCQVDSVTLNTADGRYLNFPVPGLT